MTIQEFKTTTSKQIKNISSTPMLDLNILLEHILNWDRTYLLTHSNEELSSENLEWLKSAIEKRLTGVPVAYLTGIKQFYGLDFIVTPDVLIPKPDTEILVERAVELVKKYSTLCRKLNQSTKGNETLLSNGSSRSLKICDMCTGSGCIGISVLKCSDLQQDNIPDLTLVDISQKALEVAKQNNKKILDSIFQDHVFFVESNLFANISEEEKFDLILTNPPYVPAKMVDELLKDGRSEPRLALDGDVNSAGDRADSDDGLEIIRNLLPQAKEHLTVDGTILLEAGEYNIEKVKSLGENLGLMGTIHKDLEGQLRMIEFINQ